MEGRTAIVTGGAGGIGEAIGRALYAGGARVALVDLEGDRAAEVALTIDPSGERAAGHRCDVRERASLESVFDSVEAAWGPIGILVNNAGVQFRRSVWEIEAEEWDEVLAVNLRGVFFGCQIAGPKMRANGYGRIVNHSSLAGQQGGLVMGAHYAASKAGVTVLTKILAAELAGDGVTVNAIAPAAIEGPLTDALGPERIEALAERIPVGRLGRAEEVAALVAFLASDEAAYTTGSTYDINGGAFMR